MLLVAAFFACQVLLTNGPSSYFMGKIPAQSIQQETLPLEDDQAVAKLPLDAGSQEQVVDEKERTSAETAAVSRPGKLRFDWTNMSLTSPMAKTIQAHMNNCSLPLGAFHMRNRMGLGSDLHVWSQVLCNAMDEHVRVWSLLPWQWRDEHVCDSSDASSLSCYFPTAELLCEGDSKVIQGNATKLHEISSPYNKERCPSILGKDATKTKIGNFRAAAMEYLFRNVSPALVQEAERQFNIIFPEGNVPQNLITVQIRWGDKKKEMKLLPAEDYVKGVQEILEQRRDSHVGAQCRFSWQPKIQRQYKPFKKLHQKNGTYIWINTFMTCCRIATSRRMYTIKVQRRPETPRGVPAWWHLVLCWWQWKQMISS